MVYHWKASCVDAIKAWLRVFCRYSTRPKDILPTERTHESENKEVKMSTITYEGEAKSHIHKLF